MKPVKLSKSRIGLIYELENESGIFTDTLEYCEKIFEDITSPALMMAFDPGNFVRNNTDPLKAYKILKDKVAYFHVKDAAGDKFVPSGEDESNIGEILKLAYSSGFNGFLSIEPHLGYLTDLSMGQQFSTACNALKKTLNEYLEANLDLVDLNSI